MYEPRVAPEIDSKQSNEAPESQLSVVDMLRIAVGGMGIILVFAGLLLTVSVFGLIKDIVKEPQVLNTYLDAWEGTLGEVEPAPASPPQPVQAQQPPTESTAQEEGSETETADSEETASETPSPTDNSPNTAMANTEMIRERERPKDFLSILDRLVQAFYEGEFARPFGALIILIFTLILSKIPFSLIAAGIRMAKPTEPKKKGK